MIAIRYKDTDGKNEEYYILGGFAEGTSEKCKKFLAHGSVYEVNAADEGLAWIMENMRGLPYRFGCTDQTWYGDHAKFISANLVW